VRRPGPVACHTRTVPTDPIPGLELPTPPVSKLQEGLEATIAELEKLRLLRPHHQAAVELCRFAAAQLARNAGGPAYGVAQLIKQLQEALSALPEVDGGDAEREAWDALVAAMQDAD